MKKFVTSAILLIMLLIYVGYYLIQSYLTSNITVPKLLYIPKGSTKSVIKNFKKSGLDINWYDYYFLKKYGYPQAGWIEFEKKSISRDEFFKKLTHSKAAMRTLTLIPGETTDIFIQQIAKKLHLDTQKLKKNYKIYAPYPDGVIFADTYKVPLGIDEKRLMLHFVTLSLARHKKLSLNYFNKYDEKKWFKNIITKASIIQKEAADSDEMPIIAKVIENRLKKGMKLQMDGTLNYGKYSHIKVTKKRIKEDSSPFNTYKTKTLPPYPVSSVSTKAIDAVLNPANVDYLYFVKGSNGKHLFSTSYKKHIKNIYK